MSLPVIERNSDDVQPITPEDKEVAGSRDLHDIWTWNAEVPKAVDSCVHDHIKARAEEQPDASAICAWDGELSYRELEDLSTRLACQLLGCGIGRETIVPLCFEKSMWTPVAMLAVTKAGGAAVTLDSTFPEERLRSITQQVDPKIVLSSVKNKQLACRIGGVSVMAIDYNFFYDLEIDESISSNLPKVAPTDKLYIAFTSGSTGTPKGVMISHGNFSSAIHHQQKVLSYTKHSRVYDFTSYSFDLTWSNLLLTCSAGGCLCIPMESDRRSNMAKSMRSLRANYAHLTPSVARLLNPSEVQSLRTLNLIGEVMTNADVSQWSQHVELINTYGPTECTVMGTFQKVTPHMSERPGIGRGMGANTWVVDPDDHNLLVPIGAIGELLLEGPIVGMGYLSDEQKTEKVFVQDPVWLRKGSPGIPGRQGQLYKTGDLVRYNTHGSLMFVGRKDEQVKIRGQRVELGEVEHHVRQSLVDCVNSNLVAEVITPKGSSSPILVTFVALAGDACEHIEQSSNALRHMNEDLEERLADRLPAYMIPSVYLQVETIPITATGKTDRRKLREIGGEMTLEQLAALNLWRKDKRKPSTGMEKKLQQLWAIVLGIEADSVGIDDSFFQIGGDSIAAMRLVSTAREEGISLTVFDIFKQPRLGNLAKVAGTEKGAVATQVVPFSLLRTGLHVDNARTQAAVLCEVELSQVEDIFPCTPLQEGLLAMTAKRTKDYTSQNVLPLQDTVHLDRFRAAWEEVVAITAILRTRIINLQQQGLVQVVIKNQIPWNNRNDIRQSGHLQDPQSYLEQDDKYVMGLGTELSRAAIVLDKESGKHFFIWTLHHAVYDGWSMQLILDMVAKIYKQELIKPVVPFQAFVKHFSMSAKDKISKYWQFQLTGCEAVCFPLLPSAVYQTRADSTAQHRITGLLWLRNDITASTTVRAALAILLGRYTRSNDVLFGATVAGRQAAVPGIEQIAGPTIATVPVRVQVDDNILVNDFLRQVQDQATEMIEFEQGGLQYIQRLLVDTGDATKFQTLLVVQPLISSPDNTDIEAPFSMSADPNNATNIDAFNSYALMIVCQLEPDGAQLMVSFDSKVIERKQVERVAQQLEHVLRHLCAEEHGKSKLCDIDTMSPQDLLDIWTWNAEVPKPVDSCVHDVIASRGKLQPNALAICAWDGEISYEQLDVLSTCLAQVLVDVGIGQNMIVPLCFEKSMWTPVAMLAVMKAGGVSVALDTTLPEERLLSIVEKVQPVVILSSATKQDLARRITTVKVTVLNPASLQSGAKKGQPYPALPCVKPTDNLYVVFTSGSTGIPKGVIISHRNFCSAMYHQKKVLAMDCRSRLYDFASYAFDAAWFNALHVLSSGGCLCIPSEGDSKGDIAASMRNFQVNCADLTPSVARLLSPSDVPELDTLFIGGEALSETDITYWRHHVQLVNMYGPAECTIVSTIQRIMPDSSDSPSIGRGIGANTWVVDPCNHNRLVPIGMTGELLIEGPIVGMGYLSDAHKTKQAFIHDPLWLLQGNHDFPGRQGQLYKTGDLVYYNCDGTLVFVGRKDTQVKIRGQRVELEDIEYHIRLSLVDRSDVRLVVEVVTPKGSRSAVLVAFVAVLAGGTNEPAGEICVTLKRLTEGLENRLADRIPSYMIPQAYILLEEIPITATGKTDRQRLRVIGGAMTLEQLVALNPRRREVRKPCTAMERKLQQLWAAILEMEADSIGLDDNFLQIGGDSIRAMQLVSAARMQGVSLNVINIMKHPRLSDQANAADSDIRLYHDPEPFSLIDAQNDVESYLKTHVYPYLECSTWSVLDVLPVTNFQTRCIRTALEKPLGLCYHFYIDFPLHTSAERVINIGSQLWENLDIFRTVFIESESGYLQVVLGDFHPRIDVYETEGDIAMFSRSIYKEDATTLLRLGSTFTRFLITKASDGHIRLTMRLSHAQYDGISISRITSLLDAYHSGRDIDVGSKFAGYINHIQLYRECSRGYWEKLLHGSQMTTIRSVGKIAGCCDTPPSELITLSSVISAPTIYEEYTSATLFIAISACALAKITSSNDVVLGLLVSGRSALPQGLQDVIGPCLNTIPVRVRFGDDKSLGPVLECVQEQRISGLAYESSYSTNFLPHRVEDDYGVVIQFQNIDEENEAKFLEDNYQLKVYERKEIADSRVIGIFVKPKQGSWEVTVLASAKHYSMHDVDTIHRTLMELMAQKKS